ncbi:Hypothetical predicted protein, partial [Marmota monax]
RPLHPGGARPSGDPAGLQGDRGRTSSLPGLIPLRVEQVETEGHGHTRATTPVDHTDPCGPTDSVVDHTGPSMSGVSTRNLEANCEHRAVLVETRPMAAVLRTPGGRQVDTGSGAPDLEHLASLPEGSKVKAASWAAAGGLAPALPRTQLQRLRVPKKKPGESIPGKR